MNYTELIKHAEYKTSRSSGKGGQHVNKVESKVELLLDIRNSPFFTELQKQHLLAKLQHRIDSEGVLHIVSQSERSQIQNKEKVQKQLVELLRKAFAPVKVRRATKPSQESKQKRLEHKRKHAEKKLLRGFNPKKFL